MTIALRRWCDEPRYMASMSTHMRPAALVTFSSGSVVVVLQLSDSNRHCTAACLTSTGSDVAARVRAMSWDDELLIVSVRRWRAPLAAVDDDDDAWLVWLDAVTAPVDIRRPRCSVSVSDLDLRNHGCRLVHAMFSRWVEPHAASIVSMLVVYADGDVTRQQ